MATKTRSPILEEESLKKRIGATLRAIRREKGWSEEEVANRTAFKGTTSRISRIERGQDALSIPSLCHIIKEGYREDPKRIIFPTPKAKRTRARVHPFPTFDLKKNAGFKISPIEDTGCEYKDLEILSGFPEITYRYLLIPPKKQIVAAIHPGLYEILIVLEGEITMQLRLNKEDLPEDQWEPVGLGPREGIVLYPDVFHWAINESNDKEATLFTLKWKICQ